MDELPKFSEFFNSLSKEQYIALSQVPEDLMKIVNDLSPDIGSKVGNSEQIVSLTISLNVLHAYHDWLSQELKKLK